MLSKIAQIPGPTPANRLVTRTAAKNRTNGAPVPVNGISHILRANALTYHGDGEEIPKYGVLEQDVDAKLHAITKMMRDVHRGTFSIVFGLFRQCFPDSITANAPPEATGPYFSFC